MSTLGFTLFWLIAPTFEVSEHLLNGSRPVSKNTNFPTHLSKDEAIEQAHPRVPNPKNRIAFNRV